MTTTREKTFWGNIDIRNKDECWEWKGSLFGNGYGRIHFRGKCTNSHRVAYILTYGPVENDMHICHKCDNKKCCNPYHLFPGTRSDNMKDMEKKGRSRHPPHYHNKLDYQKAQKIRELFAIGHSKAELSRIFNITIRSIYAIVKNKQWVREDEPKRRR